MDYGKGAGPAVLGVSILPFTGDNTVLFIVAASLVTLGVAVLVTSLVLARKNSRSSIN